MDTNDMLLQKLPDIPRWIQARYFLQQDDCKVLDLRMDDELSFVVVDKTGDSAVIVGTPNQHAIQEAIKGMGAYGDLIVPMEHGELVQSMVPSWSLSRVSLYVLPPDFDISASSLNTTSFIDGHIIEGQSLPEDLRPELLAVDSGFPISASWVGEQAVSFCYADAVTDKLWNISIDTLEDYRHQGHAAEAVIFMIRYMHDQGRSPVWAAAEDNRSSWKLAEKLGFVKVDEIAWFKRVL